MSFPYSALLELNTHTLLCVSANPPSVVFLADCTPNTYAYHAINLPNYRNSFFLANTARGDYVRWTWVPKQFVFVETSPELITEELREKSRLACAKSDAIWYLMNSIGRLRERVGTGVKFQETVYIIKRLQAEKFRDAGYPEDMLLDYPYIAQYADLAGIPLRTAADDIIYKARIDDGILSNTETLRIKHFNALKNASTIEEVELAVAAYRKDRSADL